MINIALCPQCSAKKDSGLRICLTLLLPCQSIDSNERKCRGTFKEGFTLYNALFGVQAGLEVVSSSRWHFGTTYIVIAKAKTPDD